jgi:hypothetical protein
MDSGYLLLQFQMMLQYFDVVKYVQLDLFIHVKKQQMIRQITGPDNLEPSDPLDLFCIEILGKTCHRVAYCAYRVDAGR